MVALTYYLATLLKGSSLLACMCLGAVLTNIIHDSDDVVKVSEGFTPPIYMMFFVISGRGVRRIGTQIHRLYRNNLCGGKSYR